MEQQEKYIDRYFMHHLRKRVQSMLNESTHVCGMCRYFEPYHDRDDYGCCNDENGREGLGFDCSIGNGCRSFERVKRVEFELKVVDE